MDIEKKIETIFDIIETTEDEWRIALRLADFFAKIEPSVPAPSDRILGLEEVCGLVNMNKDRVYALGKKKIFPKKVEIPESTHSCGWRLSDIMEWIESPREWADNEEIEALAEEAAAGSEK